MDWTKYREIYTDVWNLHKKHFGKPEWDSLVAEMQEINKKHGSKFCQKMLVAVAEDLNGNRRKSE